MVHPVASACQLPSPAPAAVGTATPVGGRLGMAAPVGTVALLAMAPPEQTLPANAAEFSDSDDESQGVGAGFSDSEEEEDAAERDGVYSNL